MPLTSWEMREFSRESKANFQKFSPHLEIGDRGPIVYNQWRTLKILLSDCLDTVYFVEN